jgi:hypothetical protein
MRLIVHVLQARLNLFSAEIKPFSRLSFSLVVELLFAQEVRLRLLPGNKGLAICQTTGKRASSKHPHSYVLHQFEDAQVCPVQGVDQYVSEARGLCVDVTLGYLFRPLNKKGEIANESVSYSTMYERFVYYFKHLGLYKGDTPHGLRAWCAVTLTASGAAGSVSDLIDGAYIEF